MKRVVIRAGMLALAVVSMTAAAHAADIARRPAMPTKAPAYEAPLQLDRRSISASTAAAASATRPGTFSASARPTSTSMAAWSAARSATTGRSAQVVFGLEGDLDWSNIKGSTASAVCVGGICETRNNWLGTTRGRVGYAFGRLMPYVTGGAAFGDVKSLDRARQRNRNPRRLDARRRRRSRHRRPVERQGRIPLCRSRQGELQRGHLRHVDQTSTSAATSCAAASTTTSDRAALRGITNGPGAEGSGAFHSRHPQPAVPFTTDGFRGVADWPRCPAFAIAPRNRCRCDRVECAYRGTAHLRARPSRINEVRYEKASARKRGCARAWHYVRVGRRHRPASRSV